MLPISVRKSVPQRSPRPWQSAVLTLACSSGIVWAFPSAYADTFAQKCPDLPTCAKSVSEITGQRYVFDNTLKATLNSTANVEFNKDNAELLFTAMLNTEGLTRLPLGKEPKAFQIMRQRDARDAAVPLVRCDKTHAPELPDNYDIYTVSYKASNPEVVEHIARNSRSFMPANSRIIPYEPNGTLLVTDTALNLKKLYGIIQDLDHKPTAEMRKKWAEDRAAALKREQQRPPEPRKEKDAPPSPPATH